jgi:3-deoxy-D-manno-octulosonic-acid transferase
VYLIYSVGLGILLALAAPAYAWKGRRSGKYLRTFRARMGHLPAEIRTDRPGAVWIHAVSVGEVLAARALVEPLRKRLPGRAVFVSTTTVTGHEVARAKLTGVDGLFFAPFDFAFAVRRVLRATRPALVVLVETEIWPNLIRESRRSGARVAIVNGRLSPRSFPRYRRIRALLRPVLAQIDAFLMQAEPHADRARAIGAPAERVRVSGNLKFDALPATARTPALERVFADVRGPVLFAGSTVAGEEELVLEAYRAAREVVPGLRLVIAPRHPERFPEAAQRIEAAGLRHARRSTLGEGSWGDEDVLLLDTLGELAHAYTFATVVFVGGSLVPAGGHNILEPAMAGRAVVVGPHMENFQEIARTFLEEDALVQVDGPRDLGPALVALLTDAARRDVVGERARRLVERNRGALDRTVDALAELVA